MNECKLNANSNNEWETLSTYVHKARTSANFRIDFLIGLINQPYLPSFYD